MNFTHNLILSTGADGCTGIGSGGDTGISVGGSTRGVTVNEHHF